MQLAEHLFSWKAKEWEGFFFFVLWAHVLLLHVESEDRLKRHAGKNNRSNRAEEFEGTRLEKLRCNGAVD